MSVSVADEIVNGDDFNNETSTMDVGDSNKKEPITINADDGSKIVGGETIAMEDFDPKSLLELSSTDGPRRSTRASAKRAQQRIRGEPNGDEIDDKNRPNSVKKDLKSNDTSLEASVSEVNTEHDGISEPEPKIRKLVDPLTIDFSDPQLAIQLTDDGKVVYASDESEVSTLTSKDIELIRKNFNKLKSKELGEEQQIERDIMIQELKALLRIEESGLSFMKKMRAHQRMPIKQEPPVTVSNQNHLTNRSVPNAVRGQHPSNVPPPPAYRPPVAVGASASTKPSMVDTKPKLPQTAISMPKGTTNFVGRPLYGVQSHTSHIAPSATSAMKQSTQSSASVHMSGGRPMATAPTVSSMPTNADNQQTPAQRQAAAKLALRKQLEKTLLQIPHPRPPPVDMQFVPNPNHLEFVTLVGLDEIVDRLMCNKMRHLNQKSKLKVGDAQNDAADIDGSVEATTTNKTISKENKKPNVRNYGQVDVFDEPFACVQCGVDFTPAWKRENGRIKCEQCFRNNKKKSLKVEHTNRLKQAFVKALQQEQEIERQINEGTFNLSSLGVTNSSTPTSSPSTKIKVDSSASSSTINKHHTSSSQNHVQNSMKLPPSSMKSSVSNSSSSHSKHPNVGVSSSHSNRAAVAAAASAQQHANAAAAGASSRNSNNSSTSTNNPLHQAAMGYPAAQMMANLGWNQLMAAAVRYPQAQQQAAAALAMANMPQTWMQNMQNLPADFVKTFQQLQQQQLNATFQQQQKILRDAIMRPQKWK